MVKVVVVYHSGFGHTKRQAEAVHRGARAVAGIEAEILTTAVAAERLDALDAADALIFGCPTYMGSMSAEMKGFLEKAAAKWFTSAWKDKIAGAFTNSSSFSGDKLNTLFGLVVNAMQHGMIYVGTAMLPAANDPSALRSAAGPGPGAHNRLGSFVGPMAASFQLSAADGPPPGDLETAELYGRRVAEVALRFARGARG
ncbi:MAG: flavodoxin family protein [Planctomycetota bacterium]